MIIRKRHRVRRLQMTDSELDYQEHISTPKPERMVASPTGGRVSRNCERTASGSSNKKRGWTLRWDALSCFSPAVAFCLAAGAVALAERLEAFAGARGDGDMSAERDAEVAMEMESCDCVSSEEARERYAESETREAVVGTAKNRREAIWEKFVELRLWGLERRTADEEDRRL